MLTILGEAERYGAVTPERRRGHRVCATRKAEPPGVVCIDGESGERFEVEADNVINATGVWADRIRPEEIHDEAEVPRIAPSRGTHVTVAMEKLAVRAPPASSRRARIARSSPCPGTGGR